MSIAWCQFHHILLFKTDHRIIQILGDGLPQDMKIRGTENYRNNSLSHRNDSDGRQTLPRGRRKLRGQRHVFLY